MEKVVFVVHMIGLAMAIGSGVSIIALKMGSADMEKPEREPYMLRGFSVLNIGMLGIILLTISGLVMLAQSSGAFIDAGGHFFRVKIVAFLLYVVAYFVLRKRVAKARLTNGGPLMINMAKFVMLMNFLGVVTIVTSVLAFH